MKTENLAIILTDIVGYTEATSRLSRKEQKEMLNLHNQLLFPIVRNFGGKVVKTIGDALLLIFRSPTDGMLCSMAMQDALYDYNRKSHHGQELHIRIAASLGEVRVANKDIFGEPVNLTSRIESITPEDEIYLSDAIYMAMNKAEVPCIEVGMKQLKGITEPVRIWKIPRFSTSRLVPEEMIDNEDIGELSYPYGGAHLTNRNKDTRGGGLPVSKTVLAIGFLLVLLVAGGAILMTRPVGTLPPADKLSESRVAEETGTGLAEDRSTQPVTAKPSRTESPPPVAAPAPQPDQGSQVAAIKTVPAETSKPQPVEPKIEPTPVTEMDSSPPPDPNAKLLAQIESDQGAEMRTAAKHIARKKDVPVEILAAIEKGLEKHYLRADVDRISTDALAWYCKILGQSSDPAYLPILEKVSKSAPNKKLKNYARKSLAQLRKTVPK